jgi:spore maturation protein CgeB
VLRDTYLERGWISRAWTWHEAADTRRFHPLAPTDREKSDLVWIGNWGDGERSHELQEFLLEPVGALKLSATIHGVRYPDDARAAIARSGARYGGFLPNFEAPAVFAEHKLTVHVPRRFYTQTLPGIPTIRVFEALACGIPLVCAPWDDAERMFAPGEDYLVARDGTEMKRHLRDILHDDALASALSRSGLARIAEHHTCAHRVDELFAVQRELEAS